MVTVEEKCMQLVQLMYSTKHNTKLYNEVFLPQYNDFREYCLIFMSDEEFGDMWNNCNNKPQV